MQIFPYFSKEFGGLPLRQYGETHGRSFPVQPGNPAAARRVALAIGNSAYYEQVARLPNPARDARAVDGSPAPIVWCRLIIRNLRTAVSLARQKIIMR